MKKTILTVLLATLCLFSKTNAQFYKPSDKTARMGETLQDSFYQTIHRAVNAKTGKATTIQLKNYQNKLIILDFWATWCGPCIKSLNKLDTMLQKMHNEQVIVLPVTYQTATEAKPAFDKFKWNMNSIIADTTLSQIFPHSGIPHQVWIKDGKVIAMPQWSYTTIENINLTLMGKQPAMVMNIQDKVLHTAEPITSSIKKEDVVFQSVLTKQIDGAGKSALKCQINGDTIALTIVNLPALSVLYEAYKNEVFSGLSSYEGSGVLWFISDSLKAGLRTPKINMKGNIEADAPLINWKKHNLYTYQLYSNTGMKKKEAVKIMQHDISRYFESRLNLESGMGLKKQRIATLSVKNSIAETKELLKNRSKKWKAETTDTHYHLRDVGFKALLGILERTNKGIMARNKTGISLDFPVQFDLSRKIDENPSVAAQELAGYGLVIKIMEMQLPVLIVKEKGYQGKSGTSETEVAGY
jgi:thiol-disulfide isomerase/thioredoxin